MHRTRTTSRLAVGLLAAAGSLFIMTGPALADPPVNAPNGGSVVTLHCDAIGQRDIVTNGWGLWTKAAQPQHVVGSTQVLVAYAEQFDVFPVGGQPFTVVGSKPAPGNARLDVCRASLTFVEGRIDFTWWVSYTPS